MSRHDQQYYCAGCSVVVDCDRCWASWFPSEYHRVMQAYYRWIVVRLENATPADWLVLLAFKMTTAYMLDLTLCSKVALSAAAVYSQPCLHWSAWQFSMLLTAHKFLACLIAELSCDTL